MVKPLSFLSFVIHEGGPGNVPCEPEASIRAACHFNLGRRNSSMSLLDLVRLIATRPSSCRRHQVEYCLLSPGCSIPGVILQVVDPKLQLRTLATFLSEETVGEVHRSLHPLYSPSFFAVSSLQTRAVHVDGGVRQDQM